jgi:hypothetical protein
MRRSCARQKWLVMNRMDFFNAVERQKKTSRDCLYESGVAASNCLVCWRLKRDVMPEQEEVEPIEHVHLAKEKFFSISRRIERFQCAKRREPHTINGSARYLFVEWRREKGRKHPCKPRTH